MTTATLVRSSMKKIDAIALPRINWKVFYMIGFFIISTLLIFYVFSVNRLTNGTYLIRNYQVQLNTAMEENKKLEVGFAKTGFMGNIKEKAQLLSFERVKEVKYIQITEGSVAKAK